MKKTVFGIFKSENELHHVVDQLRSANFSIQDISVIVPTKGQQQSGKTHPGTAWTKGGGVSEGATARSEQTKVFTGTLGKLSNGSSVNIPGAGPFLAAGPIKNLLTGSKEPTNAGSLGFLTGTFLGLGIPVNEAKRLEEKLKKGSVLIAFQTNQENDLVRAKEIFNRANAEVVALTADQRAHQKK